MQADTVRFISWNERFLLKGVLGFVIKGHFSKADDLILQPDDLAHPAAFVVQTGLQTEGGLMAGHQGNACRVLTTADLRSSSPTSHSLPFTGQS